MALILMDIISFELAERCDNLHQESTNLSSFRIRPVHSVIYFVLCTIKHLLKWVGTGRNGGSKIASVQTVVIPRVQRSLFLHLDLLIVDLKGSSAQNVEMIILWTVECGKKIN